MTPSSAHSNPPSRACSAASTCRPGASLRRWIAGNSLRIHSREECACPTMTTSDGRLGQVANPPMLKRSNFPMCQRKSFRMHSYEIAYALTLLESHSYRKTGGVGGLIVNHNQPLLTSLSVSYRRIWMLQMYGLPMPEDRRQRLSLAGRRCRRHRFAQGYPAPPNRRPLAGFRVSVVKRCLRLPSGLGPPFRACPSSEEKLSRARSLLLGWRGNRMPIEEIGVVGADGLGRRASGGVLLR